MKTGYNQEGIGPDQKKERMGKFLRARSPESLKDDGKLSGIVGHALHDAVDFGAKAIAETGSLGLIPVLRLEQFRARGLSEKNRPHYGQRCSSSALRDSHVKLWA